MPFLTGTLATNIGGKHICVQDCEPWSGVIGKGLCSMRALRSVEQSSVR